MFVDVEINGIRGSSLNVYAKARPDIPVAQKRRTEIIVPGRSGILTETKEEYESTVFEIEFNYIGKTDDFHTRWDEVKKWLSAENCKMVFSDNAGWFYKIAYIDIGNIQRPTERIGNFLVSVKTIDGLKYATNGCREYDIPEVRMNPFLECHPIYKITGEGLCVLTVNGKSVKANVGQNLTIDTERMLAYRADGTLNNTALAGDYEDLYLQNGENTISASAGFDVKVIPNWRCL